MRKGQVKDMKLVTVSEMKAIEQAADEIGIKYSKMMEQAGQGVARWVNSTYQNKGMVFGLVGSGNNGGDTLVALSELKKYGWNATACLVRSRPANDLLLERFLSSGGEVMVAESDPASSMLTTLLGQTDVLLDGILGTGFQLPLKPELAGLLSRINSVLQGASHPIHIIAVDCPSGVDCDRGEAAAECLPAEVTLCMAAIKIGLLRLPAFKLAGRLEVIDIGLPKDLAAWNEVDRYLVDAPMVRALLPERKMDSHKGTFGTALVVAGSTNYTGAALLAGKAAYRIGTGLVTMGVATPLHIALAGHFPEATWLLLPHSNGVITQAAANVIFMNLERVTALLLGPGWGLEDCTQSFLLHLLKGETSSGRRGEIGFLQPAGLRPVSMPASLPPLVIDADGLRLLSRIPDWMKLLPGPAVLTPHPGEMSALTGIPIHEIQANRLEIADRFAKEWGHVVVLKGAFTVIAGPEGRLAVISVATPALAKAGTGDVLAGLITGLRAQGVAPFNAAVAGAWIHAMAGLDAAKKMGNTASVLAGDVLNSVPNVISQLVQ
jgi:hydroxyethylthiazole kinase-like uncharacterized protein yjeF